MRKERSLPSHYRQVKFQQDRQISPDRKQKKEAKLKQRQKIQQQLLQQYKEERKYYDEETDELDKIRYYSNVLQNPNYESLSQLISGTFRHARRRENLFPVVDRHPDFTLRCVYSGRLLSDSQGNMLEKCDEEHSFPQSFQRGNRSGTGRDMHAIFAASKSANGSRGNTPFGVYSSEQAKIQVDEYGATYSGTKSCKKKTYVPHMNSGAVARSTLYILVCYKNSANPDYLPRECIDWLVKEASGTEVTLWEKHRNQELFRLQGNRNPFVDYPKLAQAIDFREGWQKE